MKYILECALHSNSLQELPEGADGPLSDEEYQQLASGQYIRQGGVNVPYVPPPTPVPDIHDQIEAESRLALRSGALYELIEVAMREFLAWAQSQNPSITEADLLDSNGPYYSVGYARNKESRDRLLALLAQK